MTKPKNTAKVSFWTEVIQAQAESGLSIAKFCRQRGVAQPSFYAWRKKLDALPKFDPPKTAVVEMDAQFVPVQLEMTGHDAFEIAFPNQCRLVVPPRFDETSLLQIIQILRNVEC